MDIQRNEEKKKKKKIRKKQQGWWNAYLPSNYDILVTQKKKSQIKIKWLLTEAWYFYFLSTMPLTGKNKSQGRPKTMPLTGKIHEYMYKKNFF